VGRVSRTRHLSIGGAQLNEGRPFGVTNHELILSHRKLQWPNTTVVRDKVPAGTVEGGERKRTADEVSKAD
jgi:hypothetical protein